MKFICALIFALSSICSIASHAGESASQPQAQIISMSPDQALEKMSQLQSQGNVLKLFEQHIDPQGLSEFKSIGDELKVTQKRPLNLKVIGKNRVQFGPNKNAFIFSHNGKYLKYGKMTFQLDKRKSVYWNYSNIVSKLKKYPESQALSLVPKAHAEESYSFQSTGYDILTLLYSMHIYKEGGHSPQSE